MQFFDVLTRIAFAIASSFLIFLAGALIIYAGSEVAKFYFLPEESVGPALLDAVGYTVIAIAVFDVGKYLFEEEVIHGREMRQAREARRSLTKFLSTIAIAVFLEALVAVFQAGKTDITTMIYPTVLLIGGVGLVVGLGLYQRLSAKTEKELKEAGDLDGEGHAEKAKKAGAT
jgi:hypothetical protein